MKTSVKMVVVAVLTLLVFSCIALAQSGFPSRASTNNSAPVQTVTGTAPIVVTPTTGTPVVSCTSAAASTAGCVSAGAQTFSGAKTLDSTLTVSPSTTTNNSIIITNTDTTSGNIKQTGVGTLWLTNTGITAAAASGTNPAFLLTETTALDTDDVIFAAAHGALSTYDLAVYAGSGVHNVLGLKVGNANNAYVKEVTRCTVVNPVECAASTCTDNNLTCTGASPNSGSACAVGVPAVTPNAALSLSCFWNGANAVLRCCNVTGTPQTPAAGTYAGLFFNP